MVTMKQNWEVDIGLSECAKQYDLDYLEEVLAFKVTKVKMSRICVTVAPRPIDTNVHHSSP